MSFSSYARSTVSESVPIDRPNRGNTSDSWSLLRLLSAIGIRNNPPYFEHRKEGGKRRLGG